MILAVDPGRREDRANLGWATFTVGELCRAGVARSKFELPNVNAYVVIEAPRWYPREHKIDTNDLLDLSVFVGEIKGVYEERGQTVELVYPRTWKGTVPKDIHNRRVLEALSDEERALLPKRPRAKDFDNNMVDAIGIGLWKLGRM